MVEIVVWNLSSKDIGWNCYCTTNYLAQIAGGATISPLSSKFDPLWNLKECLTARHRLADTFVISYLFLYSANEIFFLPNIIQSSAQYGRVWRVASFISHAASNQPRDWGKRQIYQTGYWEWVKTLPASMRSHKFQIYQESHPSGMLEEKFSGRKNDAIGNIDENTNS